MTKKSVEKELERFLETDEAEVLCIYGKWGVGKTTAWNNAVRTAQVTKSIALKKYSYVSLFGLNSIEDIRVAIFQNQEPTNKVSNLKLRKRIAPYSEALKQVLKEIPQIEEYSKFAMPFVHPLITAVDRHLICLDDLERLGSGLELKQVFGLVSQLRDERGCKVVLLANEDAVTGDAAKQLNEYREKVVDQYLHFAPTPAECAELAQVSRTLRDTAISLRITNIRILKKIERFAESVCNEVAREDDPVRSRLVRSCCVLGWVHFDRDAPPVEVLKDRFSKALKRAAGGQSSVDTMPSDPREASWNATLDLVGWTNFDALDEVLFDGIRNGWFDYDRISVEVDAIRKHLEKSGTLAAVGEAWKLFHGSFDDNEEEVIQALFDSHRAAMKELDVESVDQIVRLLRQWNREREANELIDQYLFVHAGERHWFNEPEMRVRGGVQDVTFKSKLDAEFVKLGKAQDQVNLILRMSSGALNNYDYAFAATITEDRIYEELKRRKGQELKLFVEACFASDRVLNARKTEREISRKAKLALKRIGAESEFNKLRLAKYGSLEVPQTGDEREG